MKKLAFTLAEVLIVINIIGTVAAMTMPTVLSSYKKNEESARLRKFYSMMSQAVVLSELDNGESTDWDTSDMYEYWIKYFSPYIKISKIENGTYPKIYFLDGTTLTLLNGNCVDFRYDVNGLKYPNQYGKDIFVFYVHKSKSSYITTKFNTEYGNESKYTTRSARLELCKSSGYYQCSQLLRYDNWEFKDDYPLKL